MHQPHSDCSRIIIVEDDQDLRESILQFLTLKGFDVTGVGSAIEFYGEIIKKPYCIAILDLSLPDQDGLVLSGYLRANTGIRILMLTARSSLEERLAGYESGADFYLVKPVDFRELAASLSSMIQRMEAAGEESVHGIGSGTDHWLLVKKEWLLLTPQGDEVKLTAKEYSFLNCLSADPSNIVSREMLLDSLGYQQNLSGHRALESLVYRLRKKISPDLDTPIKTASGSGYTFSSDIVLA